MAGDVTFSPGLPVEIGQIDRELKKLWEQADGSSTRASLMNLAVYCRGESAMVDNTQLVAEFTREHACRAIVIAVDPAATINRAQAWISAHCHMSRAGGKQVCCEQISFLLEGDAKSIFPNIIFSHLDSDLPLYLWWQGEFHHPMDEQLLTWVDRLIYDSASWSDWKSQFTHLEDCIPKTGPRLTLCDLNWTRALYLRQALAQLFDDPSTLAYIDSIAKCEITHGRGFTSTAVLFIGWLMAQLGWKLSNIDGNEYTLQTVAGAQVNVTLFEKEGPAISNCVLDCGNASFRFGRETDSEFFHADLFLPDAVERHYLLPAGKEEKIALIDQELTQGGKHRIYAKALKAVEALFPTAA